MLRCDSELPSFRPYGNNLIRNDAELFYFARNTLRAVFFPRVILYTFFFFLLVYGGLGVEVLGWGLKFKNALLDLEILQKQYTCIALIAKFPIYPFI